MRAIDDGPRDFESRSSDEDDISSGIPSPNYHTTPLSLDTFNVHQVPVHSRTSVALGLVTVILRPQVHDHDHSATTDTHQSKNKYCLKNDVEN
ncbi:hypothetical protein TNCV_841391 [Trichonephila clavipes]|nr:hypothetical protein TNCV_841391 [Trichonephila clavipes]